MNEGFSPRAGGEGQTAFRLSLATTAHFSFHGACSRVRRRLLLAELSACCLDCHGHDEPVQAFSPSCRRKCLGL